MSEMRYLLAASYDEVDDALAAFKEMCAAYKHVGGDPLEFDAAVVAKDEDGQVKIVERYDIPRRHSTEAGFGWGLAGGMVMALFPAVGIVGALTVGGGAGALIGRLVGHASNAVSRDDLKALGEVLDRSDAGLVVAYGPEMGGQVTAALGKAEAHVRTTTDLSNAELAEKLRAAEHSTA
ncbi:MAG TPA: hypothetical protein VFZ00_15260 [Solirubrobacter sp.]|nr:hypothetical protein [Solirubrobacter sp.]